MTQKTIYGGNNHDYFDVVTDLRIGDRDAPADKQWCFPSNLRRFDRSSSGNSRGCETHKKYRRWQEQITVKGEAIGENPSLSVFVSRKNHSI